MTIEMIYDHRCISLSTFRQMIHQLALDFSGLEIKMTAIKTDRSRRLELGLVVLPAWLVNGQVLRINPMDYNSLKQKIGEALG